MSDPKSNNPGFLRKVARFVANPTTDWAELNNPNPESRESEYAKSELKAMIERKKRNDFVRKREFDTLRKIRREGFTEANVGMLEATSNLDESDVRSDLQAAGLVKAKIDEIEQQMVGESIGLRRPSSIANAPTQPASLANATTQQMDMLPAVDPSRTTAFDPAIPTLRGSIHAGIHDPGFAVTGPGEMTPVQAAPPARVQLNTSGSDFSEACVVEVSEALHDPALDEAVIAFANADFDATEQFLSSMVLPGGPRSQHAETWMALFDLYRATGQQPSFESLALDYAQQFGWSAPQWYSLPRMVAEAAEEAPATGSAQLNGQIGWACPELLDNDAVTRLRSQTLQMPLPWVLDWSPLRRIDAEAASHLSDLFRHWARESLEMRWLGGERLLLSLQESAPTGVRDADPAFWLLRLDALRLANRPDQFDEVAIDYCVTYEVSPPSWESSRCIVRIGGTSGASTSSAPLSVVSDVSTCFVESQLNEDAGMVEVASLELSGQLVGDISETLQGLDKNLGNASIVNVSCNRLIRVDFIAAGDLLNWVLSRRGENRTIVFEEAHRLVALFFGAMGITEHARVKLRNI